MEGEMKKGFTLLELIIVIIIIGVLASLGLPQFFKTVEKAKAAEGASVLGAVRSAQIRYKSEKDAYATTLGALDVEFTALKYFGAPTPYNNAAKLADIVRTGGPTYTLAINEAGTISCSVAGSAGCTQAGY